MRSSSLVSAVALALLAACSPAAPTELSKLGTACTAASECGSNDCTHGVCTRSCSTQGDCPDGFDCGLLAPTDHAALCYRSTWTSPAAGGFGTDCSASAGGCGAADPCASADGFSCHFGAPCDATAYCTKSCAGDADCPPSMFCATSPADGADAGTSMTCVRRDYCDSCGTDDQCSEGVCATDSTGARYCTKGCASQLDCPKPEKSSDTGEFIASPFELCQDDGTGASREACVPAGGVCHGASTLSGVPAGGLCAPCRAGFPSDCTAGGCYADQTGERFCTVDCTVNVTVTPLGPDYEQDSCPSRTFCYVNGASYLEEVCSGSCGTLQGICTADPAREAATCYPLH